MNQRYLQNTPATITQTWEEDGVVVDPGVVTVTITRADGTVVVTDAATTGAGAAARSYTLSAAQTASLDLLTATWVSPTKGTLTSVVEIVGGFHFSIAEARTASYLGGALTSTTTFPAATIVAMRTVVEDALEQACGVAFVPRYAREQLNGTGTNHLLLRPRVSAVSAVSNDGVAFTGSELTALVPYPTGEVYNTSYWSSGYGNLTVSYTHGYATVPGRVKRAALLLTRRFLVDSPVSDRATSMSGPDGTTQFLVTAGVREAIFDVPEANAVVEQYGINPGIV